MLANCLFKAEMFHKVPHDADAYSQKDGTEDHQEERERSLGDFKPSIIFYRENETKSNIVAVLDGEKDRYKKSNYPKHGFDPPHVVFLLPELSFFPNKSMNVEHSF